MTFDTNASLLENARVQSLCHPRLDEMQKLFDQHSGHDSLRDLRALPT